MAKVLTTKELTASVEDTWQKIGEFHALHTWLPGVESSTPIKDGRARELTLAGGGKVIEELIEEGESYHTYKMAEGPLPVSDYVSTLRVKPAGDGCVVEWEATFEPAGIPEEQAVAIIDGVYTAGLSNL